MDDELYLTAEAAALALGVSISTLYAYVSRKRIRSQPVQGSKHRRYWRADIDQLANKGTAPASGRPVRVTSDTDITLITEQGHYYRGHKASQLAETATLEEAAALLWQCDLASAFTDALPNVPKQLGQLLELVPELGAADRATAVFPLIEVANPKAFDLTHAAMCRTGADIVRWLAALTVRSTQVSTDPTHIVVAQALGASDEMADLIRRILVLAADHGFEPGTYAVRAVASAGVTPYRSVLTGLAVSNGHRTRLGRFEGLARLITEVAEAPDPRDPVIRRIREGEELPGFGSNLYEGGDPRAHALMSRLDMVFSGDAEYSRLRQAIEVAYEIKNLRPDFLLVNVYVARRLGLHRGDTLFVLARAVGWMAHAIEQYHGGGFMRTASIYTGPLPS